MQLKFLLAASAASVSLACGLAAPAYAQSTGSIEFEKEIVVTGTRGTVQAVGGVSAPDTAKAKAVLTQENIERQNPGQTILDTINQVPGVSFQNNDAYGSSGGTLNIRGFSSDRVSLTFDGVPLNDSGNYAIYSNQQLDPELIEQVNVNLGTTDVDSPTASAAGGTVNYRTKTPDRDFGAMLSGSAGEFDFMRIFAKIETGDLTASGTRAYLAMSRATNNNPFNNYGKVDKQQYNAKIYQPLGGQDFISISGHYNQNRNNFFGSLPLRLDSSRTVGSSSSNRYPANADERKYLINYPCQMDEAQAGVQDVIAPAVLGASCGTEFDRRYNPSNTGNIRANSRFALGDNLVLTIDPSYQYVKANGGGTVTGREGVRTIGGVNYTGFIGGNYYFGTDLNGDGDLLDSCRNVATAGSACSSTASSSNNPNGGVTVLAPSQTQTRRLGVISSLKWEIDAENSVRLAYTWDRARHRQTGEVIGLLRNGEPIDVFPVNNPLSAASGSVMQKRDRLSFAILHQIAAEYRGEFFDSKLVVNAGVRAPFFKRDLTNYCFTTSAGGFVDCFGQNATLETSYATANPYSFNSSTNTVTGFAPPQQRIFNYDKILPNVGFVYRLVDNFSVFGNFSQGISVPGTDNLYQSFYYPLGTSQASPKPETTDNFDLGVRYRSGMVQGSISVFYNQFQNRLASAYDPELNQTVYRNLGSVKKYGIDGYLSVEPIEQLSFYVFGSYLKSKIKDDVDIGRNADGTPIYAPTAGKYESGAPVGTFGATARGKLGPLELGLTAKWTGKRYVYDNNQATYTGTFNPVGAKACSGTPLTCVTPTATVSSTEVYSATAPSYWLVNLDARLGLEFLGLNDKTYLQLNVYNLFDKFYVGGFGGNLQQSTSGSYNQTTGVWTYGNPGFVQIGAPRTISGTVVFQF